MFWGPGVRHKDRLLAYVMFRCPSPALPPSKKKIKLCTVSLPKVIPTAWALVATLYLQTACPHGRCPASSYQTSKCN